MTHQLPLSFTDDIQTRFEAFHREHPEVYVYLLARKLMQEHPELDGFFELRRLSA